MRMRMISILRRVFPPVTRRSALNFTDQAQQLCAWTGETKIDETNPVTARFEPQGLEIHETNPQL